MNLFGIGGLELFIILLVAFLALGPSRLAGMAKGLGKVVREVRGATDQLTNLPDDLEGQETPADPKDKEERREG